MINKISLYLCDLLFKEDIIDLKNKKLYEYGFEIMLANITNALIVLTIGILSSSLLEMTLFYFIFVSLRFYCGGYHAESYFKCFKLFALTCLLSLMIGKLIIYCRVQEMFLVASLIVQGLCIYQMAPIENINKRLSQKEKAVFRKKSWLVYCFWIVIGIFLIFLGQERLTSAFSATFILVSTFMITEKTGGSEDEGEQEMA